MEQIQAEQQQLTMPRIGDPAPAFEAATSRGNISLKDYKGKWVVLFSQSFRKQLFLK
ncbi:redoxin domain-containing protein [Bacillus sp. V3]|nr:redoxin domain-containing protein [Bacillus sp. V3]